MPTDRFDRKLSPGDKVRLTKKMAVKILLREGIIAKIDGEYIMVELEAPKPVKILAERYGCEMERHGD